MEANIYNIPTENMVSVEKKIAKLNKRVAKKGIAPATIIRLAETKDVARDGTVTITHQIMIQGEEMKIDGWKFIARLNHNTDETGDSNLIYVMHGQVMPDTCREAAADCQHCGWKRKRRDTFVLYNEDDGEYQQIGRTCLSDFFGHNPESIALQAETFAKIADACHTGQERGPVAMGDDRYIDLETFLTYVAKSVADFGWVNKKQERDSYGNRLSTSTDAVNNMFNRVELNDEDEFGALACAAIEFGKTSIDPDASDFMHNMSVMIKDGYIDGRSTGTAAWIVAMYIFAQADKKKMDEATDVVDEHVGNIGDRITTEITVTKTHDFEGHYGPTRVVNMIDSEGRILVTFSTGKFRPIADDKLTITGTVVRHGLTKYGNLKETKLNRVKKFG